jgi:hypothetical protein
MQNDKNKPYTYAEAGFNGFLRRSISSKANTGTLRELARGTSMPSALNFDNMQVSGSLGDTITVGNITIDGATGNGRIDGHDENDNTVWRLGDLEG